MAFIISLISYAASNLKQALISNQSDNCWGTDWVQSHGAPQDISKVIEFYVKSTSNILLYLKSHLHAALWATMLKIFVSGT